MGIKITRSSSELHPEGWFLFAVAAMEESQGKHGRQIKWSMESREAREDGERFRLTYWTGTVLSNHPDCKLSRLLEKLGVNEAEFEEDTDCALAKLFCGKVEWDHPSEENARYSNIVKVEPKGFLKAKGKDAAEGKKTKASVTAETSNYRDPFADE